MQQKNAIGCGGVAHCSLIRISKRHACSVGFSNLVSFNLLFCSLINNNNLLSQKYGIISQIMAVKVVIPYHMIIIDAIQLI